MHRGYNNVQVHGSMELVYFEEGGKITSAVSRMALCYGSALAFPRRSYFGWGIYIEYKIYIYIPA